MPHKCKEAKKAYKKAYREANKESLAAYHKAYYQDNKEKAAAYYKVYYQDNKEKNNERQAKRQALKLNQIPVHLRDCPKEKERLQQTYKLCHLFTKATGVLHHVDHMWPLSKGGPHWSGNLQIITAKENLSKGYKINEDIKNTIQEMLEEEEKLHKQKDEQDA